MGKLAIQVDNLGKQYRIGQGAPRNRYKTLRDTLAQAASAPVRKLRSAGGSGYETIWALKNVSFTVQKGEILGIIGRNGAGKSTLLKLLSRITEPTEGSIDIFGRVGSLLEVGTGFHPELTGRENIYLNGAILGMKRHEIDKKFDEIVDFAEVAKFIDTPVKHYSSGMYLRLAFAVAAHLEPEILLVDEVLAVGDTAFQRKCLGKMGEVANQGRTVLFVSHNMASIQTLCNRGVLLNKGSIEFDGEVSETIQIYVSKAEENSDHIFAQRSLNPPSSPAWFSSVEFHASTKEPVKSAVSGQPLNISLHYQARQEGLNLEAAIGIYNASGEKIVHLGTVYQQQEMVRSRRSGVIVCHLPRLPLPEGRYYLNVSLRTSGQMLDRISSAAVLDVIGGDFYGTGKIPPANESKVLVDHQWMLT